jgi:hypothetical protein
MAASHLLLVIYVLLFKAELLIPEIYLELKLLETTNVKEYTDQFFNIYRLKKRRSFFGNSFFISLALIHDRSFSSGSNQKVGD